MAHIRAVCTKKFENRKTKTSAKKNLQKCKCAHAHYTHYYHVDQECDDNVIGNHSFVRQSVCACVRVFGEVFKRSAVTYLFVCSSFYTLAYYTRSPPYLFIYTLLFHFSTCFGVEDCTKTRN